MNQALKYISVKIMVPHQMVMSIRRNKILYVLCFCILYCCTAKAQIINADKITKHQDNIVIKRNLKNKNHGASLYQDHINENLFFTSNGKQGKNYQLFLFDMDGKLVGHTRIVENQTELVSKIGKGNYLFEVFSNDERIENGSIAIK